jgi:DNA-binding NtrC family response regulator
LKRVPFEIAAKTFRRWSIFFLSEAAHAAELNSGCQSYVIDEEALQCLQELDYSGNIRALRNLIFELTSYVKMDETIPIQLVQFIIAKLQSPFANCIAAGFVRQSPYPDDRDAVSSPANPQQLDQNALQSFLKSIARDGDIILPIELCVLRREENFKQWTARAKRCSIEAAREASGESMRMVAERLGLTRSSLLGHLNRAKEAQNQSHFESIQE